MCRASHLGKGHGHGHSRGGGIRDPGLNELLSSCIWNRGAVYGASQLLAYWTCDPLETRSELAEGRQLAADRCMGHELWGGNLWPVLPGHALLLLAPIGCVMFPASVE